MIRRAAMSLGALVLVVAVAVGLALISPLRRPAAEVIELPRSTSLTCAVAGTALVGGSGPVTVGTLDGAERDLAAPVAEPLDGPAELRADSRISAGVLVDQPQSGFGTSALPQP